MSILSVVNMESHAVNGVLLALRVVVGLTMAAHGYQKFFMGGKIAGTAGWFESLGMKPGKVHALVAASTEIGSGLLVAMGLALPLAGAAFVGVMFVAAYIHRHNGFFVFKEGVEYNVVLALIGVTFATMGGGTYSLDDALDLTRRYIGWKGLAIGAGVGLVVPILTLAVFYRPPAGGHD